ncbi:MAG: phage major capsid protein [Immundisolibacteraceae bacterium]|nr:phage major capsid protein [Immundisolibacteraceae bacterium]
MEDESIKDLKIEKFKLVASAREIFDKAQKDDKGVLNQEQTNSTNKMFDRIKAINASVKLKEQMNEIEKIDVQAVLKDHPATTKNKDIDFMVKALKVGSEQVLNSMQVDSDETGGFLTMPQQISKKLLIEIEKIVHIRKYATVHSTNSINGLGYISVDDGFDEPDWTGEISNVKESKDFKLGKRELGSHPLSKLVKVSRDLIAADGFDIVSYVMRQLAYKFGQAEEKAYILGTGAAQPLGILTQSKMGVSADRWISGGNTATLVKFDNLKRVKQAVHPNFRKNGRWLLHSDVVLALALIKDSNGQYIWQSAVKDGEHDRLLNSPILESEFMPKTFTSGLAIGVFADLSQYHIHDYKKNEFQVLRELYAPQGKTGFISRKRTDGMPLEEKAFAVMKLA